ncbi:uncharacterized protein [Fopius arisanus]|uniref:Uncharacterized protein n=1 Tax=Fopius arisanus TaxID=64838 RepID=A0A9R1TH24_9HYME|nr:PREDICTED: uncharacterized protein LOC105270063 [Fopius arisanus]
MLEGWYCRSIANNSAEVEDDEDDSPEEEVPNYKDQYRNLKRKLKFLIYVRLLKVFMIFLRGFSSFSSHGFTKFGNISITKGDSKIFVLPFFGVLTYKKKKPNPKPPKSMNNAPLQSNNVVSVVSMMSDGHMTPEEVERHLESRQTYLELVPEKAPPTVPTEMFSNDPSLDSESNDLGEMETSPSNMGEDCLSVEMMGE